VVSASFGRDSGRLGLGATLELNPSTRVFVNYDAQVQGGLAIHVFPHKEKSWMPVTSTGMTVLGTLGQSKKATRFAEPDGSRLVPAIHVFI
jgi:hypothetical protein